MNSKNHLKRFIDTQLQTPIMHFSKKCAVTELRVPSVTFYISMQGDIQRSADMKTSQSAGQAMTSSAQQRTHFFPKPSESLAELPAASSPPCRREPRLFSAQVERGQSLSRKMLMLGGKTAPGETGRGQRLTAVCPGNHVSNNDWPGSAGTYRVMPN